VCRIPQKVPGTKFLDKFLSRKRVPGTKFTLQSRGINPEFYHEVKEVEQV
jgi:hypothetical protein